MSSVNSSDTASPTQDIAMQVELIRQELAKTILELKKRTEAAIELDHTYRLNKAKAFLKAEGKTVDLREAEVELLVNEDRKRAKLAAGLENSATERLRNLRSELQAVTSLAWVHRSEMELAR